MTILNKSISETIEYSKRVSDFKIKQIADLMDQAYWMVETDPETLTNAGIALEGRPSMQELMNNAKEKIWEAIEELEKLEDLGISKLDNIAYDLKCAVDEIGSKTIDISIVDGR